MLRWVILSVVVVVLATAATLVAQYRNVTNTSWDIPAGIVQARGASAPGRGGRFAYLRVRSDVDPEDGHAQLDAHQQG